MNKKIIGPLKLWHLVAIGAIAGLYWWYKNRQATGAGSGNTGQTGGLIDPNTGVPYSLEAVDPTTGLPYSQEIGGGSGGTGGGGSPLDSLAQELMDLQGINEELQAFGFGGIQPATGGSPSSGTSKSHVKSLTGQGKHIDTHPGGAFYKYYERVTGHAPPSTLSTSNYVYQMWKHGVKAVGEKTTKTVTKTKRENGGKKTPGHTITTHHTGQKSAHTNALHGGHKTNPTHKPSHQRIQSHTPVHSTKHTLTNAGKPGKNKKKK